MNEPSDNQERMTTIPSRELRALRNEIKQLQVDLDKERRNNSMLLYLMGWGRDRVDDKEKWIITLQEKVSEAISMLESSADPLEIVGMLKGKVDFYESHPTVVLGMNELKKTSGSSSAETV